MDYLLVVVAAVILLAVFIGAFVNSTGHPPKGRIGSHPPLSAENPAADEPTPGASDISAGQADAAQRHTPPA
jgi:hypothetical protein